MTIESWSPDTDSMPVENFNLDTLLILALEKDWSTETPNLTSAQITWLKPLMKQSKGFWQENCSELSAEKLRACIYFFTLLEDKYNECEAGNDSPVIALNKILKLKKEPLTKDDLLWIKQNSRNNFLPNGSIF